MARKDHNTILPLYSRLRPLLSQPPWRRGPARDGWQHRLCHLYRLWPSLTRPSGQGEARARPPATSTCHCTAAADAALITGLRCTLPLSGEDVRCRRSSAPEFVLNESFSTWNFFSSLSPTHPPWRFARRERWALRHGRREDLAVLRAISTLLSISTLYSLRYTNWREGNFPQD